MTIKVFKPSRENLHPNIIRTLKEIFKWHYEHYYHDVKESTVNMLLDHSSGWTNGVFTVLNQDGGEKHHGNTAVLVFNKDGVLIDDRIYFNPIKGQKIPKKAFIGTPIIDGSGPMKFKPRKKKDAVFFPPF